jgi:hypothetical protein
MEDLVSRERILAIIQRHQEIGESIGRLCGT